MRNDSIKMEKKEIKRWMDITSSVSALAFSAFFVAASVV